VTFTRPVVVDTFAHAVIAFPMLARRGLTIEPPSVAGRTLTLDVESQVNTVNLDQLPSDLIGPISLRGDCLAPLLGDGPLVGWFEPLQSGVTRGDSTPEPGDVVLVSVDAVEIEQLIDAAWRDESRREALSGQRFETLLTKQYHVLDGVSALLAIEPDGRVGALALRATVRGVLRCVAGVEVPRFSPGAFSNSSSATVVSGGCSSALGFGSGFLALGNRVAVSSRGETDFKSQRIGTTARISRCGRGF
jgi:hypothetical protein